MKRLLWITGMCLLVLLVGCQPKITPTESPTSTVLSATPLPQTDPTQSPPSVDTPDEIQPTEVPVIADVPWIADGVVTPGEYSREAEIRGIRLWWRNDAEYLYMAMEGATSGWIAIGIEPSQGMKDADYILGYVKDGEALIWDAFGTAPTGANHPPDEELGGTNDIIAFAGVEENGITRFEFQIPLNSGDVYDKVLVPGGTYNIIVAMGRSDDFNAYHPTVGRGQITLDD